MKNTMPMAMPISIAFMNPIVSMNLFTEKVKYISQFLQIRERGFKDTALCMMRDLVQFVQLKRTWNPSVERC